MFDDDLRRFRGDPSDVRAASALLVAAARNAPLVQGTFDLVVREVNDRRLERLDLIEALVPRFGELPVWAAATTGRPGGPVVHEGLTRLHGSCAGEPALSALLVELWPVDGARPRPLTRRERNRSLCSWARQRSGKTHRDRQLELVGRALASRSVALLPWLAPLLVTARGTLRSRVVRAFQVIARRDAPPLELEALR